MSHSSPRLLRPQLATLAVSLVGVLLSHSVANAADKPTTSPARQYANALSQAFREAAEEVLPSVVWIQKRNDGERQAARTTVPNNHHNNSEPPPPPRRSPSSMGSGVVIDESGVVLTNHHVVSGPGRVRIRLQDGREFDAVEVRTDPKSDLAVVRIENATGLKAARLGDSDGVRIGDWVLAVGHPFGLTDTVTAGIISAKSRGLGLSPREDFLQTDAAVNPGNSGGPLINLDGEVIGINTAISSRSGGFQGASFAIPINLAEWVSRQLIANGTVKRAYLGITMQPVTPDVAHRLKLPATSGTLVSSVMTASPAAEAGLRTGDVIVEFDGLPIGSPRELQYAVEQAEIGQPHAVVVIRGGRKSRLSFTGREQPGEFGMVRKN